MPDDSRQPSVPYDSPRNKGIDWQYLEDVLDAKAPADPERLAAIDIYVHATRPFESLRVGTGTLVSDQLRKVLEPACQRDVEFLPLRVNGAPFFALLVVNVLDVLDREGSELEYFQHAPDRVMIIRRYAFKDVGATRVFKIPESRGSTFVTEAVRRAYLDSGLPGLRLVDSQNPGNQ